MEDKVALTLVPAIYALEKKSTYSLDPAIQRTVQVIRAELLSKTKYKCNVKTIKER